MMRTTLSKAKYGCLSVVALAVGVPIFVAIFLRAAWLAARGIQLEIPDYPQE